MRDRFYIAVEGVIGVGKTTLARLIQERLKAQLLLEVFEENPFLSDFYSDRERYAFQTEIFFLLSRYHQQSRAIQKALDGHALISDYTFAKGRLFAHLNLAGDELEMYDRVHTILGHTIPLPNLVIFLRADTDILMQRIASRDRSYERNMSRHYIDDLRVAYEQFFVSFADCPVLTVDTNPLNIVSSAEDLNAVASRIRAAIDERAYQPQLPSLESQIDAGRLAAWAAGPGIPDALPERADELYAQYLSLTEEIGQIGGQIERVWSSERAAEGQAGRTEARERAIGEHLPGLREGVNRSLQRLIEMARLVNGNEQ